MGRNNGSEKSFNNATLLSAGHILGTWLSGQIKFLRLIGVCVTGPIFGQRRLGPDWAELQAGTAAVLWSATSPSHSSERSVLRFYLLQYECVFRTKRHYEKRGSCGPQSPRRCKV